MIKIIYILIHSKVRRFKSLLRFNSFETNSKEGRSKERHRRIVWSGITAAMARIISMASVFISIPFALNYLGAERYGMWMTITAFITMLGFADFGLGNGVLNAISHAKGKDNKDEIRNIISNGFFILSMICITIVLISIVVNPYVPWHKLYNVTSEIAVSEAASVTVILLICFALAMPLSIVRHTQTGLQKAFWSNIWDSTGSILGLAGLVIAIWLEAGLQWLALAIIGGPLTTRVFNTVIFFGVQEKWLRPHWNEISKSRIGSLFNIGFLFFVMQIAVVVGFQSDNIIIAQVMGAEYVAQYSIAMKLFTLPSIIIGFYVLSQWPAYGEALTRGDIKWIKTTFYKTLRISLIVAIPASLFLVIFGQWIIEVWAGKTVSPSTELLWGLGAWSFMLVIGVLCSTLLNALHIVKFQLIVAITMAMSNIILSIMLVNIIGVPGAVYGSVLAYTITAIIPYFIFLPRLLSGLHKLKGVV